MTELQQYFTRQEAADYLRCSVETIKGLVADSRLRGKKSGKGGGGRLVFSRADLDACFESMEDA